MIHEKLKAGRIAQGLNQSQVAQKAGLNKMTVLGFERGSSQTLRTAYKIAEALGMQLVAVAKAETPPPPLENDLSWD